MSEEAEFKSGFVFTPTGEVKDGITEPLPKLDKDKLLEMSLDDIIKHRRQEKLKDQPLEDVEKKNKKKRSRKRKETKVVDLNLTEHEIQHYLQLADVDTTGYDVTLRAVLVKDSNYR